jgi:hypothetical protein
VKISKASIILILSFLFLLISGGVFLYDQGVLPESWFKGLFFKDETSQPPVDRGEDKLTVEEPIETERHQNPAGFAFDYNKELKLDDHPEDTVNYANIDLTAPNKKGLINITVNDTKYKDINDWVVNDKLASTGSQLDTQIAGLLAKKVILKDNNGEILAGFIDSDQVLYLITMKPEKEEKFWSKNLDLILDSFTLVPFEGEEEDSLRLMETQTTNGLAKDEEKAVYMPEEVIE